MPYEPERHSAIAWILVFRKWMCNHVKHLCHVHPSHTLEYPPNWGRALQKHLSSCSLALLPTQPGISLLKTFSSLLSSNSYSLLIFWAPLSRVTRFVLKVLPLSGWSLEAFRCLSQERKNSSPGARGDLSSLVSAWFLLGKAVGWSGFTEKTPRMFQRKFLGFYLQCRLLWVSLWCIIFDQNQS